MNQTRPSDRFMNALRDPASRGPMHVSEPNPLQKALDDYHLMEDHLRRALERALAAESREQALLSEVNMLREAFERSDTDRIRLQAIASTFIGGILSLNAVAGDLYKLAIKNGVEAAAEATKKDEVELERAAEEAQSILQRVQPLAPAPVTRAAVVSPAPPVVDWSTIPRGSAESFRR